MEQIILYATGLAATGYVAKLVWDSTHGQAECNCAGKCDPTCAKANKYPIDKDHYPLNVK